MCDLYHFTLPFMSLSGSMLIKDLSELIMTKLETDKRNPYLEKVTRSHLFCVCSVY